MTTNIVSPGLYSAAVALVKEASHILLECFQKPHMAVSMKSTGSVISPVTEADIAAHEFIVRRLEVLEPRLPVVSEEAELPQYSKRKNWEAFWILDPLDGTKEFVNRSAEFTINLALVAGCRPLFGVVNAPALGITYHASLGGDVIKEHDGRPAVRISVNDNSTGTRKIVTSRSHPSAELEKFLSGMKNAEVIKMGSSLKFCLVAEGVADLYPRLGPTMEWDTAAGQCIAEAAGASVTTLDEMPLHYNKEDLRNPYFIVSGSPSKWWRAHLVQ